MLLEITLFLVSSFVLLVGGIGMGRRVGENRAVTGAHLSWVLSCYCFLAFSLFVIYSQGKGRLQEITRIVLKNEIYEKIGSMPISGDKFAAVIRDQERNLWAVISETDLPVVFMAVRDKDKRNWSYKNFPSQIDSQ